MPLMTLRENALSSSDATMVTSDRFVPTPVNGYGSKDKPLAYGSC